MWTTFRALSAAPIAVIRMRLSRSRPTVDLASYCGEREWSLLQQSLTDADEPAVLRLVEEDIRRRINEGKFPVLEEYLPLFEVPPAGLEAMISELLSVQPTVDPSVESASLGDPDLATTRYFPPSRGGSSRSQTLEEGFPEQIDQFKVIRPLGQGAFGTVLLASDAKLDRKVAIKVPNRHLIEQSGVMEQFLEESRSIAKMSHPGIVPIFNSGLLDDGRAYAVLEYIPGGTLAERLRRQPLQIMEAVDLMIQLADAIHYAHQRGIFHLDLKPSNILLDENGNPKISDFGLALNAEKQLQLKEYVGGTPSYMSPEQTRGETRRLDGRSDIWALGVILYLMLAERLPFRAGDTDELFDAIQSHDPRPLRQINDLIPLQLDHCARKCLEKQPRDRYETAGDLSQDLRDWKLNASGFVRVPLPSLSGKAEMDRARSDSVRSSGSTARDESTVEQNYASAQPPAGVTRWLPAIVAGLMLFAAGVVWKFELLKTSDSHEDLATQRAPELSLNPVPKEVATLVNVPVEFSGPLESILPAGEWNPLLDRPPRVLHWPLIERGSTYEFKPTTRELWLTVDGGAMMELGQTQSQNYRLRVLFSQSTWTGGTGLFWGYQPVDGKAGAQYMKLDLISVPVNSRSTLAIRLAQVQCNENGTPIESSSIRSKSVDAPSSHLEGGLLEIEVQNGELVNVWWCGVVCPELVVPNSFAPVTIKPQSGLFGILGERSHTIVRRTAFKYTQTEDVD